MSTLEGSRVTVIGAGVAGLATAALLANEGASVDVFEARGEIGGRAGSWASGGFRFETGPSWYLMPEVFEHFFRLLGTSADAELDLVRLDPAYRVYSEGADQPIDVRSGADLVAALFDEIEPGAGARLHAYLESSKQAYDLAVSRFLYDPYSTLRALRDPALLRHLPTLVPLLTGSLASFVERRFKDPRLQQILEYPAVFLGGSPYEVPALYHLMSNLELGDSVAYPQGGFTALIQAIARLGEARGVRVHLNTEVVGIDTTRRGGRTRAHGVRVRAMDADTPARTVAADIVVGAGDLHHLETSLLPERLQTHPERLWQRRTPSPGALLLLLGVEGSLPQLAHHTLLFANGWRENFSQIFDARSADVPAPASLYVCRPSASDPTVAPADHENLFVLVPMPADTSLGRGGIEGAGTEAIERTADRIIEQIADWAGIPDLASRVVVRRTISPADFEADLRTWRGNSLGLSHTLAQSALFRPRNVSRRVDNLFYAGADVLPGIGVPMCLISSELVLKRLRGDDGPGPVAEPSPAATGR